MKTYTATAIMSFESEPHCHWCNFYTDWGCGFQQDSPDDLLSNKYYPVCLITCPLVEVQNAD